MVNAPQYVKSVFIMNKLSTKVSIVARFGSEDGVKDKLPMLTVNYDLQPSESYNSGFISYERDYFLVAPFQKVTLQKDFDVNPNSAISYEANPDRIVPMLKLEIVQPIEGSSVIVIRESDNSCESPTCT